MDKSRIIQSIQKNKPASQPLPENFPKNGIESDLANRFCEILKVVGAEVIEIDDESLVQSVIESYFPDAVDLSDPKSWGKTINGLNRLDKLHAVILKGQIGIAENGAVWLDETNFPERIIPFICSHLIIKLFKKDLLSDIIEAYENIDLKKTAFGVFISGPSKTADIEQVLVFGAHGPLQHTVLLIN